MEMEKNQEAMYIDLYAILRKLTMYLRRFWALVLVLAVLGGGLMYVKCVRSYRPMYKSEAVFSVSVNYSGNMDLSGYSYYYDRNAAKLVTETFPHLLRSQVARELICQRLGTSYINGTITPSSTANTNLFTLTVTSSSAQDAYDIIRAVIDVYPQVSRQVIGETQLIISREPLPASAPYNDFVWKNSVIKGAAAGAMLGAGILVLLSFLRRTALSTDDVKRIVNLSCLARVPNVKIKQRKNSTANTLLISKQDSDSPFCESFRLLRLKLMRTFGEGDKVILFTSSVPSEGKSSLAVNTALALAKNDKKVLLIDADLRGPSIKGLLNLTKPSSGMGEFLRKGQDSVKFLRYEDSKLYIFAGDEAIQNPTSLLQRSRLKHLIDSLRPSFDYIILDTPPCTVMADAATLCPYADKVIYVIREDFASTTQIYEGIQSISATGTDLCGFIFNRATTPASHYGYGYGRYGYGYGYGYGHSKKPSAAQNESQSKSSQKTRA